MSRSRKILVGWAVLFVVLGGVMPMLRPRGGSIAEYERATDIVLGIATLVLAYVWCRAEATDRGTVPPGRSALWAAIVPPIGVPAYLFRTRAPTAALNALGKAIAYYVGVNVLFATAEALVHVARA